MRKIAMMVGAAVAMFAIVAVAEAANVYEVSLAKVTDASNKIKAGTVANPKPARIAFGYKVSNTDPSQRPTVTTDYDIDFGNKIRQNRALFTARNNAKFCSIVQAGYGTGQLPNCPAGSQVGKGVVKNLAGPASTTGGIPCSVALTVFVGDGKVPPSTFANDGKPAKNDLVLQLEGHPGGVPGRPDAGTCPLDVNKAALPAMFVRKRTGSTSLAFHVPRIPFQEPTDGVENAVVDVTSNVFKTVQVRTRVCTRRNGRTTCRFVTKTRGLFETIGCTARNHKVEVTYTDKSGAVNKANKNAPCTP